MARLKLRCLIPVKDLSSWVLDCTIQLFSALRKEGLDELAGVMGNWYQYQAKEDKNAEASVIENQENRIETSDQSADKQKGTE